jgi:CBS domain containing-hemolysin-like protein
VPGGFALEEFNERSGRKLEAEGVETVGGWLITHLGRIPQAGEKLRVAGESVEILEAEPRRVLRVKFHPPQKIGGQP